MAFEALERVEPAVVTAGGGVPRGLARQRLAGGHSGQGLVGEDSESVFDQRWVLRVMRGQCDECGGVAPGAEGVFEEESLDGAGLTALGGQRIALAAVGPGDAGPFRVGIVASSAW